MKGSRKCSAMGAFVAAALSVACMLDPRILRGLSFAAWQVLLFCLYYAEFGAMALMLAWIAWRLVLEREWRGYQLCTAAANNHVDELRRLLQAGVKPLSYKAYGQGGTALHYACAKGHREAVRSLLQAGEHELLTTCLANGSTSLHVAAEHGHVGVVRELLKSAASTDKQALLTRCSHEGISCLIAAVQRGHLEVATYLAREGGWGLVQLRAEGGHSCLHFAARAGHAKMIEMLVEAGEACDARNNDGRTALHEAACFGQTDAMRALLDNRADPSIRDNLGRTALTEACDRGCNAILVNLEEKSLEFTARPREVK